MDESIIKKKLFELTPQKFEELCADLLNSEHQFDRFFITDGPNDQGVDILALKGIKKIAIQVKHRYQFRAGQLRQEIEQYKPLLEFHHEFIFISSAPIAKTTINELETEKIKIISQNEILELLKLHEDVSQRYFKASDQRKKNTRRWLSTSLIGLVLSVSSAFITFFMESQIEEKPLEERITSVENALKGLHGLEKDLESIREDMIQTDLENKRILEEYEKMKGLEEFVNNQKESLNIVLNYQPWYKKALNYILGVLTGIFTSIVGSILWERYKLKRQLSK